MANDSAQLNAVFKSSDLIGITPVVIEPQDIGRAVGVFTAIECKDGNGRVHPGQENFLDHVRRLGGMAGVARSIEDYRSITQW